MFLVLLIRVQIILKVSDSYDYYSTNGLAYLHHKLQQVHRSLTQQNGLHESGDGIAKFHKMIFLVQFAGQGHAKR